MRRKREPIMDDPRKESPHPSDDSNAELEHVWFPRDGEPVRHKIPARFLERLRRERLGSEPYVRFRVVGVRGCEYGLEFPDYPDVGTLWVDSKALAVEHRKGG
jgi:hypothetical protein